MSFNAIAGTFHIQGYSPDGDSIRFAADNLDSWDKVAGRPVQPNARGHVQLRLEAIDTLETHFAQQHQPLELADRATEALFTELGITDVAWDANHQRVTQANDATPGFILTRSTGTYGRPVAFVMTADQGQTLGLDSGQPFYLRAEQLAETANQHMLARGMAYPTFYTGLFQDLRSQLANVVKTARGDQQGLWPQDRTNAGVTVSNLTSITDDAVILPKLFRRLASFLETGGSVNGFKNYLAKNPYRVMVLPDAHFTSLDNLIEVDGDTVRLTRQPEDLVFMES